MSFEKMVSDAVNVRLLKAYLIVFDNSFGGRANIQAFFDTKPGEIMNWLSPFEGAIFFVSPLEPRPLAEMIRGQFPASGSFLVTQLPTAKDGWLLGSAWDFINKPTENPARPGLARSPFGIARKP